MSIRNTAITPDVTTDETIVQSAVSIAGALGGIFLSKITRDGNIDRFALGTSGAIVAGQFYDNFAEEGIREWFENGYDFWEAVLTDATTIASSLGLSTPNVITKLEKGTDVTVDNDPDLTGFKYIKNEAGDQVYSVTDASNVIAEADGDSGIDTLDYSKVSEAVDIDLAAGGAWSVSDAPGGVPTGPQKDIFNKIENAIGSAYDDVILTRNESTFAAGGLGGDTMTGGNGNDILVGGAWFDALGNPPANTVADGGASIDGGNGNDTIIGDNGSDTLNGGAGSDLLSDSCWPGVPDHYGDTAANDTMNGGDDSDWMTAYDGADEVNGDDGNDWQWAMQDTDGTVVNGGDDDDGIVSLGVNNTLNGGSGHDYFAVLEGDATVNGGAGDSTITVNPSAYAEITSGAGTLYIGDRILTGTFSHVNGVHPVDFYYLGDDWWAFDGGTYLDIYDDDRPGLTARITGFTNGDFGITLTDQVGIH